MKKESMKQVMGESENKKDKKNKPANNKKDKANDTCNCAIF